MPVPEHTGRRQRLPAGTETISAIRDGQSQDSDSFPSSGSLPSRRSPENSTTTGEKDGASSPGSFDPGEDEPAAPTETIMPEPTAAPTATPPSGDEAAQPDTDPRHLDTMWH